MVYDLDNVYFKTTVITQIHKQRKSYFCGSILFDEVVRSKICKIVDNKGIPNHFTVVIK